MRVLALKRPALEQPFHTGARLIRAPVEASWAVTRATRSARA